jgi:hypothetical protein
MPCADMKVLKLLIITSDDYEFVDPAGNDIANIYSNLETKPNRRPTYKIFLIILHTKILSQINWPSK